MSKKPNIIIILTDDQGYGDVGFNGSKQLKTPNLDQLAKNGVIFTNGYVSYAVCGPSRAGIITGRYQDRFGFSRNPLFTPKDASSGLPLEEETISEYLKKAGYNTMAIGKWHLGAHTSQRPLNRGFDEFFGFLSGGHKYFPEELTRNDLSEVRSQFDAYNTKLLKNDKRVDENEYLTDAFSREAVNFIAKQNQKPFFLYLAYNAPHAPLQATEKYLSRYHHIKNKKRKTYAAMVSAVDDGVGLILNKLKELKIEEAQKKIKLAWDEHGFDSEDFIQLQTQRAELQGWKYKHNKLKDWLQWAETSISSVPQFLDDTFPGWEFQSAEEALYENIDNIDTKFKKK